jgi:hypothetical protein
MAPMSRRGLGGAWVALSMLAVTTPTRADDASCVAATEQAFTLRQQGKLHDALKQLAACADTTCPDEVKQECAKRIADIDAAMPSLILAAKDLGGNDIDAVEVTMDGQPFAGRLDGRPITVDPGEHKFHYVVSHAPPAEKTLIVREGERGRRESIVIQLAPPKPVPFWSTPRVLGLVSGVVGLAGIGVGAVFGGYAAGAQSQEQSNCSPSSCLHPGQASTDYDYARQNATASTVLFISGGVLAATGVILWLLAPKHTLAVSPSAWLHGGSLRVVF